MEYLGQDWGRDFWFLQLDSPKDNFELPFDGKTFGCLLVPNQYQPSSEDGLERRLIASRIRYMCAFGKDSAHWHHSFDMEIANQRQSGEMVEDILIMTTQHDDESMEDAIFFLTHCTRDCTADEDFRHFLILFLGDNAALKAEVFTALRDEGVAPPHSA